MRIIGYSDLDLIANRTGILSERQKQIIQKNARTLLLVFGATGLVFALLIGLTGKRPLTEGPMTIAGLLGCSFIAIGIALYWLQHRDYQNGIVKYLVGTIEVLPHRYRFVLSIDGKQLPILFDLRGLFEENAVYKVYYTPAARKLVSLEKV